jgi:hypothetical protein
MLFPRRVIIGFSLRQLPSHYCLLFYAWFLHIGRKRIMDEKGTKYQSQIKNLRTNYVRFPLDFKPDVLSAFRAACEAIFQTFICYFIQFYCYFIMFFKFYWLLLKVKKTHNDSETNKLLTKSHCAYSKPNPRESVLHLPNLLTNFISALNICIERDPPR